MPDLYVFGEGHVKGSRGADLSHVCLKVYNPAGDELSVSFDDSCGAFKHLQRVDIAIFDKEKPNTMIYHVHGVDADKLCEILAHHLGYDLVRRDDSK